MTQLTNKERTVYFDILRIIAVFGVVLSHVTSQRFYDSFPSNEWTIRMVYNALGRWSVPVFVMISGALFLNASKRIDIKKLFTKNITRIIYVFLFWSVIYTIYEGINMNNLGGFVNRVLNGPFHFWFLKMLIGLYITVPILRAIVSNKKPELYFICLALITLSLTSLFFPAIGAYNTELKHRVIYLFNCFEIKLASGYVGLFVLGHYLNTYQIKPSLKKAIYIIGIISLFAICLITYFVSNHIGAPYPDFFDVLNIFTIFEAISIFVLFKNIHIPCKYHSFLINVSKTTLGIYLIHVLLIHVSDGLFGINSSSLNPAFFVPVFSLLVFIISSAIVSVMMRIPILKKFVL